MPFSLPGGTEWLVVLIIALLLFGKRLPEVMRSLGQGIVEFKKGIRGVEDDIDHAVLKSGDEEMGEETDTTKENHVG